MRYSVLNSFSSSILYLPILTLPSYSDDSSSITGANRMQGPHQVAQKSTTTGSPDAMISLRCISEFKCHNQLYLIIYRFRIIKPHRVSAVPLTHCKYTQKKRSPENSSFKMPIWVGDVLKMARRTKNSRYIAGQP